MAQYLDITSAHPPVCISLQIAYTHSLVQLITTVVSSRVEQPCHAQKSTLPYHPFHPALGLYKPFLLYCLLSLDLQGDLDITFHVRQSIVIDSL